MSKFTKAYQDQDADGNVLGPYFSLEILGGAIRECQLGRVKLLVIGLETDTSVALPSLPPDLAVT